MSDLPDLKLQVSTLSSHQQNLRELIQVVLSELPRLKADIAAIKSAIDSHKGEVGAALGEFGKLKSLVATIREEFARNLTSAHSSILVSLENKVKLLPLLVQSHDALQAQVDKFQHVLDSVALDSKNAILKTNNVEVVTTLNMKKIDNLRLRLENLKQQS